MGLAGRPITSLLVSPLRARNYVALLGMVAVIPDCLHFLFRYVTGRGNYPYQFEIRTPLGSIRPTLYSHADLLTVNEIFCRRDYRVPGNIRVVVDIGSNIGISALYFLTRNRQSFCYLFEPVPQNVTRLHGNLEQFKDRYVLRDIAVSHTDGVAPFGIEDTGRYGGLNIKSGNYIDVVCCHINDALDPILEREETIDLLKLDIEGDESQTVAAISNNLRERIKTIVFEGASGLVRLETQAIAKPGP